MMEQFNSMKYDVQGIYSIDKTDFSFSFMSQEFYSLFHGEIFAFFKNIFVSRDLSAQVSTLFQNRNCLQRSVPIGRIHCFVSK